MARAEGENDDDNDGQTLSISGITQGSNGSVSINGDGTLQYTPNSGFFGSDSFTYNATDGTDESTGTVSVSISENTTAFATFLRATDSTVETDKSFNINVTRAAEKAFVINGVSQTQNLAQNETLTINDVSISLSRDCREPK